MTYQPMTNEIRCLIRGLALCYGSETRGPAGGEVWPWDKESLDLAMLETELSLVQELHPNAGLSCGPRKVHVAGDNFWDSSKGVHVFHTERNSGNPFAWFCYVPKDYK